MGTILSQKALEFALNNHAITQIDHCGITKDNPEFPEYILTTITKKLKNYQKELIKDLSLSEKIREMQTRPIHEHLESEGFSIGQKRRFVFTSYNKNEKWRQNKLARIFRSVNIPINFLDSMKIPEAPNKTRLEFSIWKVERFYSFDPTLLAELDEELANEKEKVTTIANRIKEDFQPTEFKNDYLTYYILKKSQSQKNYGMNQTHFGIFAENRPNHRLD